MKIQFYKFSLLSFLSFFSVILIGQNNEDKRHPSQSDFITYVKYGVGIFEKNSEPTYNSLESKLNMGIGMRFNMGVDYRYYLSKKWSLNSGLGYEYFHFVRKEEYQGLYGFILSRDIKVTEKLHSHNFILPLKGYFHLKKMQVSFGIINTYHLATRLKLFIDSDQVNTISLKDRNYTKSNQIVSNEEKVKLEKRLNFQGVIGIHIPIHSHFQFDLEYRNYLSPNPFILEYPAFETVPNYTLPYKVFNGSFFISLKYFFF